MSNHQPTRPQTRTSRDGEVRHYRIEFRVSEEERSYVRALSEERQRTISDICRAIVLRGMPTTRIEEA